MKRLPLGGENSSELLGVFGASPGDENSSSFCPFRLSRAGLMRGLRWRKEPELEATELATEGAERETSPAGDTRDGGRLPLNRYPESVRVRGGMVPSERARLRRPGSEEGETRRGDRNSCCLVRGRKPGGVGMNRDAGEDVTLG